MPVVRDSLTSTKNRPLPVDPEGTVVVKDRDQTDLLNAILGELTTIRLILSGGLNIDLKPEDLL